MGVWIANGMARPACLPAGLLALAGLALLAGCTGETPNSVGTGLVEREIGVVLEPALVEDLSRFTALAVSDEDRPLKNHQVLYLGSQDGSSSNILANFDFDSVISEDFPDTMFTRAKIANVKMGLTRLSFYGKAADQDTADTYAKVAGLYYRIDLLTAPFDSNRTTGLPEVDQPVEIANQDDPVALEPRIQIFEQDFLDWLAAGGVRGFMFSADFRSDDELVGFASRDMTAYQELDAIGVGDVVAPSIDILFESGETLLIAPVADISTWHEVAPAPSDPQDGFILRGGLRSCPALWFDLSVLPENAFINRAVFAVTNDTTSSFGPLQSVVISELDTSFMTQPQGSITLDELADQVYVITGRTNLDPVYDRHLRFDVTQAVQRAVNRVYEGDRGWVLTAGEDFASFYDITTIDPEFYFSELHFLGISAPDSLRPRLEITYSLAEEYGGGGDE